MENTTQQWKTTTGMIYKLMLTSVFIVFAIVILVGFAFAKDSAAFLPLGMFDMSAMTSSLMKFIMGIGILTLVLFVISILFYLNLWKLRNLVHAKDQMSINLLFISLAVSIFISVLAQISEWMNAFSVIIFVLNIMCFARLMSSQTFPAKARKGAAMIFWSLVGGVIGCVIAIGLSFILPFGGAIIFIFMCITSLVLYILGWRAIAKSDAPQLEDEVLA